MIKQILLASMAAVFLVAACLTAILGGCDGKSKIARDPETDGVQASPPTWCPAPAFSAADLPELGSDSTRIGRLEERAIVDATLFPADGGEPVRAKVTVSAGTWLVPAGALDPPGRPAEGGSK